jgi:catechol 2,3-dioxygenase-like lactoylglutathione lyase family enzyme
MSEQPSILHDVSFCHLVVGVTDMDRALAFYRDVIGMEIVFEPPRRGIIGIQNVSLSVPAAPTRCTAA